MTKFIHFNVLLHPKSSTAQRKKYQSRTVAVDPLSDLSIKSLAQTFLNKTVDSATVTLNIGLTYCSLKDRYAKKDGRAEAIKRMAPATVEVKGVLMNSTHIFIELAEYKGVTMFLRLNKKTGFSTVTGTLTVGG